MNETINWSRLSLVHSLLGTFIHWITCAKLLELIVCVMNWVKGSKGIIDILLLVKISILLIRIFVFIGGLRLYRQPNLVMFS